MTKMTRLHRPLTLVLGLTAAVVLASCSQPGTAPSTTPSVSPSTTATDSPTVKATGSPSTTPSSAPSAGKRIDVSVTGKQVTPAPATVNIAVGESLTIAVTSDKNNTLHAHGFEVAKDIKAGQQAEVTVKGAEPGVYEFELHSPELLLFKIAVR